MIRKNKQEWEQQLREVALEMYKALGSAVWVLDNRHNKNLPEWEEYAAVAEAEARAVLAKVDSH